MIGDKAVYCEGSPVDQRINFAWAIYDAIDRNDRIKGLFRIAIMSMSNKNNRDYVQIDGEEIEAVFDTLNCIGDIYPEFFKKIILKNFLTSSNA